MKTMAHTRDEESSVVPTCDDIENLAPVSNRCIDFTCFTGAPALPVAVTLLVDVDSYKHNTDW